MTERDANFASFLISESIKKMSKQINNDTN
jgi:hypothetical protein